MSPFRPCRAVRITIVSVLALGAGCHSAPTPVSPTAVTPPVVTPPPVPPPPPAPTPPQPPPGSSAPRFARYRVSGRVTNEEGTPVPFARIELQYSGDRSKGLPDCNPAACWRIVEADGGGSYSAEFEPARELLGGIGSVMAFPEGYDFNLQVVPDGAPNVEVNLRVRRERVVQPGARLDLDVGPDSSLCTDSENIWALGHRCGMVTIRVEREGTLRITTRTTNADLPVLFFGHTSNLYLGQGRRDPGDWAIPVRSGTYWFFVGLPVGLPSQRIEVTTAMQ